MNGRNPVRMMVIVSALLLLLQGIVGRRVLTLREVPGEAAIVYTAVDVVGDAALCPGETLTYTLEFVYNQPGVFDVDVTVFRVTPPQTILFSETRRVVIAEPEALTVAYAWVIPAEYEDIRTQAMVALAPGQYERRHSVTTISRSTEPAIVTIPFEIGEGCE